MRPEISIVVSTYNRSRMLAGTVDSILGQSGNTPFELIVVDNNSADDTARVAQEYARRTPIVRYVFEPKQGVSHGRNAGIAAAESDLLAFTDDDVVVDPDWVDRMKMVFASKPDHGCVGGKVLPRWPSNPPTWLTPRHWSPLALLDYGDAQTIDSANRRCLITANMGIRRSVFDQVGYFSPEYQKSIGLTCSCEDREIQERYWAAGGRCWFDPSVVVHADIQPERLGKSYHRRWHFAHGQFHAMMRDPETERSRFKLLGVPSHIYRRLAETASASVVHLATGRSDQAFDREIEARFCAGFINRRVRS